jgi:hypothetical protein
MEKQQLPKLELTPNQTIRLKLLRDKPYEGKNNYGPFYLYTVSHEGTGKSFFAPAQTHQQIQEHGLRTGGEFILRTTPGVNGRSHAVEVSFEAVQAEEVSEEVRADRFKEIMQQSLQDAIEIIKAVNTIPFQNEDIRAISSCLFIARTKNY